MRTKAEEARARHRDIVTLYERNEPACPSAHRSPHALVVLVHPEPEAIRFREVEQERVHDRETLLGPAGGCSICRLGLGRTRAVTARTSFRTPA